MCDCWGRLCVGSQGGGKGAGPQVVGLCSEWNSAIDKMQVNGDLPGGPVVKNLPGNAGNTGSIPGQELYPTCHWARGPAHHN